MIERISHSLQQSVCQVQRHGHNESQTHNNDDSFEQTSQDITHALAHLVACIHSLFRHSDNGKHKAQQNAQQSHCPIGISNGCVFKKDIDEIILVGGATKLPIVRSFVAKLFGRLPNTNINPDEAVALGAAVQAAMKERNQLIKEIVLTDVCPYTLGTNVSVKRQNDYYESGHFFPIIDRNTVIPVSRTERLYTLYDNQSKINVKILQGESRFAKNNLLLGELTVDVPKKPAGEEAIDVTYTYDINSILEVEVTVVSTGDKKRIVIQKNKGSMTDEEVEKRLKELSELKIHPRDREENKLLLARGERLYEESVGERREELDSCLRKFEDILDTQDRVLIEQAYKEVKEFFDNLEDVF